MNWSDWVVLSIASLNFLFFLGAKEQDKMLKYGLTAVIMLLFELISFVIRNWKG